MRIYFGDSIPSHANSPSLELQSEKWESTEDISTLYNNESAPNYRTRCTIQANY